MAKRKSTKKQPAPARRMKTRATPSSTQPQEDTVLASDSEESNATTTTRPLATIANENTPPSLTQNTASAVEALMLIKQEEQHECKHNSANRQGPTTYDDGMIVYGMTQEQREAVDSAREEEQQRLQQQQENRPPVASAARPITVNPYKKSSTTPSTLPTNTTATTATLTPDPAPPCPPQESQSESDSDEDLATFVSGNLIEDDCMLYTEAERKVIDTNRGKNSTEYEARKEATELRFFELLTEFGGPHFAPLLRFAPSKHSNKVNSDYVFCNVVFGEKTTEKKIIINKALIVFGMKCKALSGKRKGLILEPKSFQYYVKLLFYVFKEKGMQHDWKKDINRKGEFHGVMITLWENIRKSDPLFGTSRHAAKFDEEADEKIRIAIKEGKLRPWEDPEHLQHVICFCLGRCFAMRGIGEITFLTYEFVGSGVFGKQHAELHGLKFKVVRIPFDKTNKLSLTTVNARPTDYQCFKVCEVPSDIILCPVRAMDFYFSKCHPDSQRFFGKIATPRQRIKYQREGLGDIWYVEANSNNSNSVVGKGTISKMTKKVAELAGFDDWEQCTNHGNRAHAVTKMIEAGVPLEDRMIFCRHKSANSQQPYARVTVGREITRHRGLQATAVDLTDDKKRAAEPVPKAVSKGTTNMNMGGGPRSLTTHVPASSSTSDNIEASEWEEFQKFKAMRASEQCQSVAAPAPSPLSVFPQQVAAPVASMDSNLLMQSMMNPMSSLISNPMVMNPMSSMMGMMNPMASMAMNPMASMMGMMNPMASMVNPVQMAFSMGMQMAQQNGNNQTTGNQNGNRINVEGEKPLDPNNRVL